MILKPERVVAIGASAGGLKALQDLLSQLRPGKDVAVVVAQHLAPDHSSQLVPLLSRSTQLTVEPARDGEALQPGTIYVVPPNCDATIESGCIRLRPPAPRFGPSPSVDLLFDSLATDCGERAVAIVLSGTGSDGACGLRAVGANGGLTLVQSPENALFPGMPGAAIALGMPDLVADPQTIGARLTQWLNSGEAWIQGPTDALPLLLSSAVSQLKHATGIDFSQYKESTLLRQMQRRMAANDSKTVEGYLQLLSSDANEAQALMQNLLVTVTSFFRNPEAFESLASLIQTQLTQLSPSEPYRIWVPGCATGEEAYSVGMIVSQAMGHPDNLSGVLKIFATDLDEKSLAIARKGMYPMSAAISIPTDLKERFTIEHDHDFEITKALRSCIVFAKHNLCDDPPFPDINLITCRNLLIYFTPALQERVIDLLSFSLRPGGILFLGGAESLDQLSGFRTLNPLHRLYERTQQRRSKFRLSTEKRSRQRSYERPDTLSSKESTAFPTQHIQLLDALIRIFAKPCLVLDEAHKLVEVIGDVSPFCRMPEGPLTGAAISFLRDELQAEARALFLLTRAGGAPVRSNALRLPSLDFPLRLEAAPIQVGDRSLTLLSFIEEPDKSSEGPSIEATDRSTVFTLEIERLEHELITSQDTLRRSLSNLEQANEELEASSEELQASSEELQSTNEELEASNEELQATNDELGTLNHQLRIRGEELERLNTDLENIHRSLSQGMVIVDKDLRILRFSPLAVRVFGLVEGDVGSPLIGIPTTVPVQGLRQALLSVVHDGERFNLQASSEDISYLLQLMPYFNSQRQILGAMITMTDVSELNGLRHAAEASLRDFESLADSLDQAVWKRDHALGKILYISARIQDLTGWKASDIRSHPDLLDSVILPEERASVMASRQAGAEGWDLTYRITRRDGEVRIWREVALVLDEPLSEHCVVGTLTDITDHQWLLDQRQFLGNALRTLIEHDSHPIGLLDSSLRFTMHSDSFARCFDAEPQALNAQPLQEVGKRLILQDPANPSLEVPASELLIALVNQAMETNQPRLGLPAICLQPGGRKEVLTLDLLPFHEASDHRGIVLKLHRQTD